MNEATAIDIPILADTAMMLAVTAFAVSGLPRKAIDFFFEEQRSRLHLQGLDPDAIDKNLCNIRTAVDALVGVKEALDGE